MEINVIDNGGQLSHLIKRKLENFNIDTNLISNDTSFEELDVDGLILSGGPGSVYKEAKLGNIEEYLNKLNFPILGIGLGHQCIAMFLGGKVERAKNPEFGKVRLFIDDKNELFENLPTTFEVIASHNDEVTMLTDEFKILAHSENCKIQAVKFLNKPFYGLQFQPEASQTEYGDKIFENFLRLCRK